MDFSFSGLLDGLKRGLETVETLLPIATALGAPTGLITSVVGIAGAVLETGQNVATRIEEGQVVASSDDQAELKSILSRIQAKNDELAAYIETH